MSEVHVPNFNTVADLFDRLIVCVNKLAWFENKKREKQAELNLLLQAGTRDTEQEATELACDIANWDNASRNECEIRNLLKREIDATFAKAIAAGEYKVLPDFRTFRGPGVTVSDILTSQCEAIGKATKDLM